MEAKLCTSGGNGIQSEKLATHSCSALICIHLVLHPLEEEGEVANKVLI